MSPHTPAAIVWSTGRSTSTPTPCLFHDRARDIDQPLGMGLFRRALERAVEKKRPQVAEVPRLDVHRSICCLFRVIVASFPDGAPARRWLDRLLSKATGGTRSRFLGFHFAVARGSAGDEAVEESRGHTATSSTARSNTSWLACEGFVNPLIFRTNCSAEARISASVATGSKL